jgi:hypothetical protein
MCRIVILENYALLSEVPKSTIPYLECYLVFSPNINLVIWIKLVLSHMSFINAFNLFFWHVLNLYKFPKREIPFFFQTAARQPCTTRKYVMVLDHLCSHAFLKSKLLISDLFYFLRLNLFYI